MKITFKDLRSGFRSALALNENFEKLKTELQDKVFYRDNPVGEPNTIKQDVDFEQNDLLNVRNMNVKSVLLDGSDITSVVDDARTEADRAETEADRAASEATDSLASANASSSSATASAASATAAATSATEAEGFRDEAAGFAGTLGDAQFLRTDREGIRLDLSTGIPSKSVSINQGTVLNTLNQHTFNTDRTSTVQFGQYILGDNLVVIQASTDFVYIRREVDDELNVLNVEELSYFNGEFDGESEPHSMIEGDVPGRYLWIRRNLGDAVRFRENGTNKTLVVPNYTALYLAKGKDFFAVIYDRENDASAAADNKLLGIYDYSGNLIREVLVSEPPGLSTFETEIGATVGVGFYETLNDTWTFVHTPNVSSGTHVIQYNSDLTEKLFEAQSMQNNYDLIASGSARELLMIVGDKLFGSLNRNNEVHAWQNEDLIQPLVVDVSTYDILNPRKTVSQGESGTVAAITATDVNDTVHVSGEAIKAALEYYNGPLADGFDYLDHVYSFRAEAQDGSGMTDFVVNDGTSLKTRSIADNFDIKVPGRVEILASSDLEYQGTL